MLKPYKLWNSLPPNSCLLLVSSASDSARAPHSGGSRRQPWVHNSFLGAEMRGGLSQEPQDPHSLATLVSGRKDVPSPEPQREA